MKQVQLVITGRVQGVGFRQFVKKEAMKRDIVGWVKNLPDGTVEAGLQGEEKAVDQLIALCHREPFLAKVEHVQVQLSPQSSEFSSSFTILQ